MWGVLSAWCHGHKTPGTHWSRLRDTAHQLTLLLHTFRRQDQVIDGHGPPLTSYSLDQHLQESTMSTILHNMGGIRVTPGSHGMEGARTCHGQTHILPRKGLSEGRGDAVADRGVQCGLARPQWAWGVMLPLWAAVVPDPRQPSSPQHSTNPP